MKSQLIAFGVAACLSIAHADPAPVSSTSPQLSMDVQHMQGLNRRIAFLERRLRYSFLTAADRIVIQRELEQLRQQSLIHTARLHKAGVDPNLWALRPDDRPVTVASVPLSDTSIVTPPGLNPPPSDNLSHGKDNITPKPNKSSQDGQKGGERATDRPGKTASSGGGLPAINRDPIDKPTAKAAEKADKNAAKALQKATKAVEKAEKAIEKADRNASKAVEKADRAAEKADRKAADKADKKAEKNDPADKHAHKARN
jgi:hypothetical protein